MARCERSHGANLNHVAAELRFEIGEPKGRRLHLCAPEPERELTVATDFFGKPDASTALNTALQVESHIVAEGECFVSMPLSLNEPACRRAIKDGVVLEGAFASSVANGAVERVICKQEFKNAFSIPVDGLGVGVDNHALARGERAPGLRLWHLSNGAIGLLEPNLDEAHPAHPDGLHARVIAEDRNFNPKAFH